MGTFLFVLGRCCCCCCFVAVSPLFLILFLPLCLLLLLLLRCWMRLCLMRLLSRRFPSAVAVSELLARGAAASACTTYLRRLLVHSSPLLWRGVSNSRRECAVLEFAACTQ